MFQYIMHPVGMGSCALAMPSLKMRSTVLPCSGYLSIWELFSTDIQPFTAYAPFMIIDGNHERDYPQSGAHGHTLSIQYDQSLPVQPHCPYRRCP